MPGTGSGGWASEFWLNFTELVTNGSIPEWRVDDMVIRTLTPYYALGQDTKPLPPIVWVRLFGSLRAGASILT